MNNIEYDASIETIIKNIDLLIDDNFRINKRLNDKLFDSQLTEELLNDFKNDVLNQVNNILNKHLKQPLISGASYVFTVTKIISISDVVNWHGKPHINIEVQIDNRPEIYRMFVDNRITININTNISFLLEECNLKQVKIIQ